MIHLTESQAREFAELLEGYEDDIAEANLKKSATLDDIRQALRDAGLKGSDLAADLAHFRDAVTDHRLMRVNPAKLAKKMEKREGSDFYLFLLTKKASRTHEGEISAAVAPIQTEPVTPHNPDTGEIIENAEISGAPVIETGTDIAAPESCGGVDGHAEMSMPIRSQADNASLVVEGAEGHDAAIVGIEPCPQDPTPIAPVVPVQVHRGLKGEPLTPFYPDPTNRRVFNPAPVDDIPAQFRRVPVQGHA